VTRVLDFPAASRHPVVPIVHVVATDAVVTRADFIDVACGVMRALGPRGALHLRTRRVGGDRRRALAGALAVAQKLTGAWLVADDVALAVEVGAYGVQLGAAPVTIAAARRADPMLGLGASVHDPPEADAASRAGADWLVATRGAREASAARERVVAASRTPVVAIGGIRPEDCRHLRRQGVYGVAVIRGIWDAPNAERAAGDYLSSHDDAGVA
jgi:thiamine-phosphate diphosphorylase